LTSGCWSAARHAGCRSGCPVGPLDDAGAVRGLELRAVFRGGLLGNERGKPAEGGREDPVRRGVVHLVGVDEKRLPIGAQTLRRWLIAEGLWQRRQRRETHHSRRPQQTCLGELVQMDASIHDWLEGRGEEMVLISMIDDATNRTLARFYPAGTVEAHMDLLGLWLRRYGRPRALYTDRHSIFEPQDKGHALPDAVTQFGRALRELDIELICAHSPQAKGRIERSFGTAQDRWVKVLRLAGVRTAEGANELLGRLLPAHNRRFGKAAREATDAHRPLGPAHDLAAILSIQAERVVSNDYTVRFQNRFYQLLPPVHAGQRGGRVVMEQRLDGSLAIRFREKYLSYRELPAACGTVAEPSSVDDAAEPEREKEPYRPAENHPWRKPFQRRK
jgi:hypothetical protein